jgi:uncharacterized repeat protein (TIGR03803 family)
MKNFRFEKLSCIILTFCAVMAITASAQTLTTLHNFAGSEGATPSAPLVLATNGNFYGTTIYGGAHGAGAVFKMTPSGTLSLLYSFCSVSGLYGCYDGNAPLGMVQASDGNFYGVTPQGGELCCGETGMGTIFKLTTSGTLTTIYDFCGIANCTAGQSPTSIMQASDGNLYGVVADAGYNGIGTFYQITTSGVFTELYDFDGSIGSDPSVPLVEGNDGKLYGTAPHGGLGYGTVFKFTLSGTHTLVYNFCSQANCTDGAYPTAGLVKGSDGNFYGTTSQGGAYDGGTIFKLTPSGTLTTLHSFVRADGINVVAPLVQGRDGKFYGTASADGAHQDGTIFQITTSGTYTVLYSFAGSDGSTPNGGVLQGANGNFYGTTYQGGTHSDGTVFEIEVTLSTLTVSVSGSGTVTSTDGFINCPGTCSHTYPTNTQVTLDATAASGWSFAGWSGGGCSGTGACNITMSQNESVTATFTQNSYQLSVSTSGSGTVTSTDGYINCPGTCSHTYLSNTHVTLNANPALGWSFTGWGGACSGSGSCQVTMTQNLSASATFTQNYYTLTASVAGSGTVTSTDGYINCPGSCSHTYISLTAVTLNATPASGWSFSGWTGACMGVGSCSITMTGNLAVSGVFMQTGAGIQLIPVAPCRLVDTRPGSGGGGPIQSGSSESFTLPGLGGCNIPTSAVAYSLNVTVVPQHTLGYLTIWPTGEAQPLVSLMNSSDGRVKANAAIVPAGTQGAVSVYVTDTSNVILDINGYFTTPSSATFQFFPLTPCRIIDTRNGNDGPLQKGLERDYTMAGQCGIPATATAYSFNVTVIPTNGELDYLTVWPQGGTMPVVSTLNDPTGTVVANAAIVPAGGSNGTAFYAHDNPTNLLVDVNGYFAPVGTGGYSLYPVAPCRVLDTRNNHGQPFQGPKTVTVEGSACAPPSSATAYVFNATVVPPGQMPYLTLWPDGENQPTVSTLNAYDGFITSNMAIVPTNNGSIDAYAAGLTHLILDLSGYFAP